MNETANIIEGLLNLIALGKFTCDSAGAEKMTMLQAHARAEVARLNAAEEIVDIEETEDGE